jgi:GTP-binding protein EngB required for normal cell division
MAADKSIPEDTDIQETLAERVVKLQLNISENKKEFIRNQAQIGLLGFLVDARQKLDAAEVRMMAQLGNQGRSVFSFFSNSGYYGK